MKNRKIVLTSVTITLLILLAAGYTLAWFINLGTNKVSGTQVTVSAGSEMKVSLKKTSGYSSTLNVNYTNQQLNMTDITGDGLTFYRPSLLQQDDEDGLISTAVPDGDAAWASAISTYDIDRGNVGSNKDYTDAQYIEFTVYFQANAPMDVYLSQESKVSPSSDENLSPYARNGASFSKNWIAAASRVAFTDQTGSNEAVKYIWAPNPHVNLYYTTNASDGNYGYELNTAVKEDANTYSYLKVTNVDTEKRTTTYSAITYNNKDQLNTTSSYQLKGLTPLYTEINTTTADKANGVMLTSLTKGANTKGDLYEGQITVKLWIEGTDNEARRALAGGHIDFSLVFIGFENENGGS